MNNFRNSLKTESIISLKTSLSNGKNWLFLGKPTTWPDSDNSPPLNQSIEEDMDCKMGIIALYKLKSSDFAYVIERNDWVLGRVYTEYSSSVDLKTKNYYITSENGTNLNVWICIHNGHDSESTFSPNCIGTTDNNQLGLCLLGDEYQWKLIYTVPNFASNPFCTSTHFPILNNYYSNTDENILKLNVTGNTEFLWYVPDNSNYYVDNINTNNDTLHLQIPLNSLINKSPNYYRNWDLVLRDNGVVKYVLKIKDSNFINNVFSVQTCIEPPNNIDGYTYSIVPGIIVKGSGYGFIAYSNINENTKTIESISILNSGYEYQDLGITIGGIQNNYTVTPVFSIRNNLKSSPINTLKCSELMFYKKISATGVNAYDKTNPVVLTIGSSDYESNDIRQFGIIKSESYDEIAFEDLADIRESLTGCTLLYTTRANSTKTGILLDSYICTVDGVGNITAYGIVVSIAEPPSGADTPIIAVLPLFGTFTTEYSNIKKLNINTLVTESLSPSFTITSVIGAQYIKQSGRIQYLENIYPTTLSTDTALNIRVIISL